MIVLIKDLIINRDYPNVKLIGKVGSSVFRIVVQNPEVGIALNVFDNIKILVVPKKISLELLTKTTNLDSVFFRVGNYYENLNVVNENFKDKKQKVVVYLEDLQIKTLENPDLDVKSFRIDVKENKRRIGRKSRDLILFIKEVDSIILFPVKQPLVSGTVRNLENFLLEN